MRPAAKAAAKPTMEMSIRASAPRGVRALSRRGENALYRRDQRLGRLRPDDHFSRSGAIVPDQGRRGAWNCCGCAIHEVLVHALAADGILQTAYVPGAVPAYARSAHFYR